MSAITVVCGPPCSGKSTWARASGLSVLDWDEWYAEATGRPIHLRVTADRAIGREVEIRFQDAITRAHLSDTPTAVVRAAAARRQRGMFRRLYGARVIVLEVPRVECIRRLHASSRPREVWPATEAAIVDWWDAYEPSPRDEVIAGADTDAAARGSAVPVAPVPLSGYATADGDAL